MWKNEIAHDSYHPCDLFLLEKMHVSLNNPSATGGYFAFRRVSRTLLPIAWPRALSCRLSSVVQIHRFMVCYWSQTCGDLEVFGSNCSTTFPWGELLWAVGHWEQVDNCFTDPHKVILIILDGAHCFKCLSVDVSTL